VARAWQAEASGVIGRLAMLAASYELETTDPEAEVYA
jgi:glutamate--cysteine ligase